MRNKLYPQSSNELETLCFYTSDNELWSGGAAGEGGIVEILRLRQFYKYFDLVEDADGGRRKDSENFI